LTGLCFDALEHWARTPHFLTESLSLQVLAYTLSPDPSCQLRQHVLRVCVGTRAFGS